MANKVVDAVSYDLSQTFTDFDQIAELVHGLGNPPELVELKKLSSTGAFWRRRFEPWLESNLEANLEAVYRAHERLRPGERRPGLPGLGQVHF